MQSNPHKIHTPLEIDKLEVRDNKVVAVTPPQQVEEKVVEVNWTDVETELTRCTERVHAKQADLQNEMLHQSKLTELLTQKPIQADGEIKG